MEFIDYVKTEKNILAYSKEYNSKLNRKIDTLGRVYIPASSNQISGSSLKTFMCLIKVLQSIDYKKNEFNLIVKSCWLQTTMPGVATLTGYSARTIQRHIKILLAAGVISDKINSKRIVKGATYKETKFINNPVQLIINKQFIVYSAKITAKELEQTKETEILQTIENKAIEYIQKSERRYNKTSKIKKNNRLEAFDCEKQSNNICFITKKAKKQITGPIIEDAKKQITSGADPVESGPACSEFVLFCLNLATTLFLFARKSIYHHYSFISPAEREKATLFLFEMINQSSSERDAKEIFNKIMWSIDYRDKWQRKNPERANKISSPAKYFSSDPAQFLKSYTYFLNISKSINLIDPTIDINTIEQQRLINQFQRNPDINNYLKVVKKLSNSQNEEALNIFYKIASKNINSQLQIN